MPNYTGYCCVTLLWGKRGRKEKNPEYRVQRTEYSIMSTEYRVQSIEYCCVKYLRGIRWRGGRGWVGRERRGRGDKNPLKGLQSACKGLFLNCCIDSKWIGFFYIVVSYPLLVPPASWRVESTNHDISMLNVCGFVSLPFKVPEKGQTPNLIQHNN